MCTAARTSLYSPGEPNVFRVFSLGLCFVCSFVLFDFVYVSPSFCVP